MTDRCARPSAFDDEQVVRLASPRDVLDSIPHTLGFVPRDSLVMVLLRVRAQARRRCVLTMRIDLVGSQLPAAELVDWPSVAAGVANSGATSSLMVVYADTAPDTAVALWKQALARGIAHDDDRSPVTDDDLAAMRAWVTTGCVLDEQGDLMRRAGSVLTESGAPMSDVLVVTGGRYFSLMCEDESCCPRFGTAYDPQRPGAVGLEMQLATGAAPLQDRDALRQRFDNDESMTTLVASELASTTVDGESVVSLTADESARRIHRIIDVSINSLVRSTTESSHDPGEAAWVLMALCHVKVRDGVLADVLDPLGDAAAGRERSMREYVTWLTTCAPQGLRAAPATMAAILWWIDGDGASANIALERALADQPDYRLARLVERVVRAAVPPAEIRALLLRAV